MNKAESHKYDLEERTHAFAQNVKAFVKKLPATESNYIYKRQLLRSAGSVGANYIEANEALSRKDFLNRIRICRKEAKESIHWLHLLDVQGEDQEEERTILAQEGKELVLIFAAVLRSSEKKKCFEH